MRNEKQFSDLVIAFFISLLLTLCVKLVFGGTFIGGGGDNLGNHTAEQNLNMNNYDIINVSTMQAYVVIGSTIGTAGTVYYGDGSKLRGITAGDNLGNHIATTTLNMNGYNIANIGDSQFSMQSSNDNAVGIGKNFGTLSNNTIAIGYYRYGSFDAWNWSVVIGVDAINNYGSAVGIGGESMYNYSGGTAVGYWTKMNYDNGVAIGGDAKHNYSCGVGIGNSSSYNYMRGVGVGCSARNNHHYGIGIGYVAKDNYNYGIGIGYEARNNHDYGIGIGCYSQDNRPYSTSLGGYTLSFSSSVSIGWNARSENVDSVSLGAGAKTTAEKSVAIGAYTVNDETGTIKLGYTTKIKGNLLPETIDYTLGSQDLWWSEVHCSTIVFHGSGITDDKGNVLLNVINGKPHINTIVVNNILTYTTYYQPIIQISSYVVFNANIKLSKKLEAEEVDISARGKFARDVEISSYTYGLILTSSSTYKYLVWVDDNGNIFTTKIAASPEVTHEQRVQLMKEKQQKIEDARKEYQLLDKTSYDVRVLMKRIEILETILNLR